MKIPLNLLISKVSDCLEMSHDALVDASTGVNLFKKKFKLKNL